MYYPPDNDDPYFNNQPTQAFPPQNNYPQSGQYPNNYQPNNYQSGQYPPYQQYPYSQPGQYPPPFAPGQFGQPPQNQQKGVWNWYKRQKPFARIGIGCGSLL